jgi:hypothetical protein
LVEESLGPIVEEDPESENPVTMFACGNLKGLRKMAPEIMIHKLQSNAFAEDFKLICMGATTSHWNLFARREKKAETMDQIAVNLASEPSDDHHQGECILSRDKLFSRGQSFD